MRTRERSPEPLTEGLHETLERFARSPPGAAASVALLDGTAVALFPPPHGTEGGCTDVCYSRALLLHARLRQKRCSLHTLLMGRRNLHGWRSFVSERRTIWFPLSCSLAN